MPLVVDLHEDRIGRPRPAAGSEPRWDLQERPAMMAGMRLLRFLHRQGRAIIPLVAFTYLGYKVLRVKSVDGPTAFVVLVGIGILVAIFLYRPNPTRADQPRRRKRGRHRKTLAD